MSPVTKRPVSLVRAGCHVGQEAVALSSLAQPREGAEGSTHRGRLHGTRSLAIGPPSWSSWPLSGPFGNTTKRTGGPLG